MIIVIQEDTPCTKGKAADGKEDKIVVIICEA
jgi:hypothetical protein